jgi:hypothetical protein
VNGNYAIWNEYNCGPYFGNDDLVLYGNNFFDSSYCIKSDYEIQIRETGDIFSVEEIEVFQITKK